MDVRFTPEQRILRQSVKQVINRLGLSAVADLADEQRAARLDEAVEESDWRRLRAPDEAGNPWASGVEAAIVAEALGHGLADVPFLGPTLAMELRRLAKASAATGRETVGLRRNLSALASPGEPAVAIDAACAESVLLLAADGTLASVKLRGQPAATDLTRPSVPIPTAEAVTVGSLTEADRQRWIALALTLTTADLVGSMQGALDLAVTYAGQRAQYGKRIGSFQAVAHLLADAVVHIEGARAALLYAAWGVDALDPWDAVAAAASAKAYAARAARSVCETCIQVHGGIGNSWECLAHVYLRRTLLATDVLGGVGPNLARVLEHVGLKGRL
ncbi:Acyl-CoA dehydrogenase domain protein [Frankia sp. AiPs1]|uniref:acyl-CoA dehydrogenase family protein n=1 Tax=Frankia sp. AiPa1 TaxID=573492 RepID=UPI00202B2EF2|nr:acyl-CoA dehydrogenase family protein [Frankia sp. AiPa1]MCL9762127.1 acyl-CoA dehydrogenase [Frankia sp. AiPa1]